MILQFTSQLNLYISFPHFLLSVRLLLILETLNESEYLPFRFIFYCPLSKKKITLFGRWEVDQQNENS